MAALRRKTELGRFLKHQYNAQLNRRTQEIQEELEVDGRILQALLEKREAEWAREQVARDRLMSEVLTGRQQQILEKIEQNRRAQEETLKHREKLIRSLEEGKQLAQRAKEESEELKLARKQELEAQVAERQGQEWEAARQEEEEEEEARQAEEHSNALLQQEAKTMAEKGYQPKLHGHLRIAWD